MALLNIFFGIVPRSAGISHEYGQHKAGSQTAGQQAEHAGNAENDTHADGGDDRQYGRPDHLMLRSRRGNFHAAHVIRFCLSGQDSLDFLKLAAHFLNHFFRGAADGIHGQPAKHEGHHGPHEEPHEHLRVHQGYLEIAHEIRQGSSGDFGNLHTYGIINFVNGIARGLTPVKDGNLQFFNIGGQKRQCRQSGGTDGKSLARGGGRVAQGIQGIRAAAHFRVQLAHLRITPGVVGNGAVSVRRQCQAQRGKHADGGNADAIQPLAHFRPGEMPVPGS